MHFCLVKSICLATGDTGNAYCEKEDLGERITLVGRLERKTERKCEQTLRR